MKEIGLYIHIPYCINKCGYCDFYSLTNLNSLDDYVLSVKKSLDYFKTRYGNLKINSVFFGGGTPSVLKGGQMAEILERINNNFHLKKDAEITTEANPEHITKEFLSTIKKAGINRLSFGLQSAVEKELLILERSHRNHHVKNAVNLCNQVGITNYSFDIIQSIPYQTKISLKETLDFALSLSPKHISAYMLILEPSTPLYQKVLNHLTPLSDDEEASLYLYTVDYLYKHGFNQYEISNFSKEGYESTHNLTYWLGKEYLGIGPSAHSFLDKKRFYYENSVEQFIIGANETKPNLIYDEDGGDLEEYIMLNLRLSNGFNLDTLKKLYNLSKKDLETIIKNAKILVESDLATFNNSTIALTTSGFLLSNLATSKILEGL